MSGIGTTSDKKETWAGYMRKSALKMYLKLLIWRQGGRHAEGWLKGEEGRLWRRQKHSLNFEEDKEKNTVNENAEQKIGHLNARIYGSAYLVICGHLQSVHLRKMQIFMRRCLTGQWESLHSQLQFSEVELCCTKPVVHWSPQIVTRAHLNISGNFTAN